MAKKRSKFNVDQSNKGKLNRTYKGIIYLIINKIDDKKYIGKTSRPLYKRMAEHKYDSQIYSNKNKTYLHRAMNKHGFDNFDVDILEEIQSDNLEEFNCKLNELEIYYIDKFDTYKNGYNTTFGGDGCCGYEISDKHKEAIAKAHKGIPLSEEHKAKISTFMNSEKNLNRGSIRSEEAKLKQSQSMQGKYIGEDNPMYGKKRPDLSERNLKYSIKVCQLDLKTGELIKVWDSLRECSRETGFNRSCISDCCNGKTKQSHGFLWRYYDLYITEYENGGEYKLVL